MRHCPGCLKQKKQFLKNGTAALSTYLSQKICKKQEKFAKKLSQKGNYS